MIQIYKLYSFHLLILVLFVTGQLLGLLKANQFFPYHHIHITGSFRAEHKTENKNTLQWIQAAIFESQINKTKQTNYKFYSFILVD